MDSKLFRASRSRSLTDLFLLIFLVMLVIFQFWFHEFMYMTPGAVFGFSVVSLSIATVFGYYIAYLFLNSKKYNIVVSNEFVEGPIFVHGSITRARIPVRDIDLANSKLPIVFSPYLKTRTGKKICLSASFFTSKQIKDIFVEIDSIQAGRLDGGMLDANT